MPHPASQDSLLHRFPHSLLLVTITCWLGVSLSFGLFESLTLSPTFVIAFSSITCFIFLAAIFAPKELFWKRFTFLNMPFMTTISHALFTLLGMSVAFFNVELSDLSNAQSFQNILLINILTIGIASAILNHAWRSLLLFSLPIMLSFSWLQPLNTTENIVFFTAGMLLTGLFIWRGYQNERENLSTTKQNKLELHDYEAHLSLREEALSEKHFFYISANHDIKQPLFSMKLAIELLKNKDNVGQQANSLIEVLDAGLYALENMLLNLVDISKVDFHGMRPSLRTVKIETILQNCIQNELLDTFVSQRKIRSQCSVNHYKTDPSFLYRILANLLRNAIKFSDKDVVIAIRHIRNHLVIDLYDQGIGMDTPELEWIFDENYQIPHNPYNKHRYQGSGLGLAIVKRLVNLLDGEIKVNSHLNRGTHFRIRIPDAD